MIFPILSINITEHIEHFISSMKTGVTVKQIEWYYGLASVDKASSLNFFTFIDYKIETLLFLSICGMLVLASFKASIKKVIFVSKCSMVVGLFLEFITMRLNNQELVAFVGSYKINVYTQSAKVFMLLVAVLLINMFFMQKEHTYALLLSLHTLVFLGVIMVSANNGFLLLITLENFSLLLYILTLTRKTYGGVAAGVKYFIFGTLGSIIIF
jgi:NADH:ubiquinone oxidoreductase subunit 2 (subunit N)